VPRRPQRDDVLGGIEAAIRVAALSNITIYRGSWTRRLGLASKTVLMWRQRRTPPSLWCLLVVCSQLGTSPLQLMRGEIDEHNSAAPATTAAADTRLERPSIQHTRTDPVTIRHALEAGLASDELPVQSIRLVADRRGQTNPTLRHYFPELCRSIASRHQCYRRRKAPAGGHDCARKCATQPSH